jgi:hypothetical protein
MALSDAQKQSILFYLGWPGKTVLADSTHYNSLVTARMINLTPEIESRVSSQLTKIAAIDTKLESASCRLAAKKVDTIETNPEEIQQLKRERRRLCRDLSSLLDIAYVAKNGSMVGICS